MHLFSVLQAGTLPQEYETGGWPSGRWRSRLGIKWMFTFSSDFNVYRFKGKKNIQSDHLLVGYQSPVRNSTPTTCFTNRLQLAEHLLSVFGSSTTVSVIREQSFTHWTSYTSLTLVSLFKKILYTILWIHFRSTAACWRAWMFISVSIHECLNFGWMCQRVCLRSYILVSFAILSPFHE